MPLAYRSWLNPLQRKLPSALAMLLALLCGALLARLVWQFWAQSPDTQPMPAMPAASTETIPSHAETIANQHLFGIAPPSAKPSPAAPSDAPLPNISLLGVVTLSPKMAIITVNNQEKVYSLGDTLKPSSAELVAIEAESITLKHNGRKQTIKLRKPNQLTATANPAMADLSGGIAPISPDMQNQAATTDAAPVTNTTLVEFHKEVLANPAKVMDLVAPPSPVMKDGKMLGFRIMPGKNIALFNQTGLQPGDIVTKINGTAMDSPGAGIQALQNSMNSSNVNLEVDRGGQITPISVNF